MSPPKHLWSGDWREESAKAAQELARRRGQPREQDQASPPPPRAAFVPPPRAAIVSPPRDAARPPSPAAAGPRPKPGPPPQTQTPPGPRRPSAVARALAHVRSAVTRPQTLRVGLILVVLAALVAGGAYGVSALINSGATPSSSAPASVTENGPVSWMGMQIEGSQPLGVVIVTVAPGSAGQLAGLEPGDQFVQIDGHPINAPGDITAAVAGLQPGDPIQIEISRGSTFYSTQATLPAQPAPSP